MNLTIGVVIPAYNAQQFIIEALDSVLAQTHCPSKIVVVDDGSSDDTFKIASNWAASCPIEIEVLTQANAGCAAARNAAISRLDVELIALLDADDVWESFHLQKMHEAFQQRQDLALCFADHQKFNDSGIVMHSFLHDKQIKMLTYLQLENGLRVLQDNPFVSLLAGNYVPPSTSVIAMKFAKQIGFFDATIRNCEDRDFVLRLSRRGQFAYYPQPHARYRVHDNNVTHSKNAFALQYYALKVLDKLLGQVSELNLSPEELRQTKLVIQHQAESLLYCASLEGIVNYLQTCLFVVQKVGIRPVLSVKNLLRAIFYGYGNRRIEA